ncbi:putative glycosyltransferase [Methylophaga frappieri]|uniref:Putative glycosyltransferase n=1 Tax=Methylophaga frappieri (strain ATCC BAA-2434 / DSM 25690 / JAM7) TaxID=754477 RepID=I1YGY9_METFJ|nr:PilZ domain-containing protein [Methylophaga frappieri]AFJ02182.1 putative glycosyltransferase [Methylophaga frappieri]
MPADFEEKRDFQRLNLTDRVHFRATNHTGIYRGLTLDISASGMRMQTDAELTAGETLTLIIPSHHSALKPFSAEAVVIRIENTHPDAPKVVSLNFTDVF